MHKHRGAEDINSLYQQQQKMKRKAEREKIKQEVLARHNYRGGEHDIQHEIDLKHRRDAERERKNRAASFIRKYRGGKNDFGHRYKRRASKKKSPMVVGDDDDDESDRETEQIVRDIGDVVSFFETEISADVSLPSRVEDTSRVALIEPEVSHERRKHAYRYSRASVRPAMFSIIEGAMDDVSSSTSEQSIASLDDVEEGKPLPRDMNDDDSNSCNHDGVQEDNRASNFGYFNWTDIPSYSESSDSEYNTTNDSSSQLIPLGDTQDFFDWTEVPSDTDSDFESRDTQRSNSRATTVSKISPNPKKPPSLREMMFNSESHILEQSPRNLSASSSSLSLRSGTKSQLPEHSKLVRFSEDDENHLFDVAGPRNHHSDILDIYNEALDCPFNDRDDPFQKKLSKSEFYRKLYADDEDIIEYESEDDSDSDRNAARNLALTVGGFVATNAVTGVYKLCSAMRKAETGRLSTNILVEEVADVIHTAELLADSTSAATAAISSTSASAVSVSTATASSVVGQATAVAAQ